MRRILSIAICSICVWSAEAADEWGGYGTFDGITANAVFNTDVFRDAPNSDHEVISGEYAAGQNPLRPQVSRPNYTVIIWPALSASVLIRVRSTEYPASGSFDVFIGTVSKAEMLSAFTQIPALANEEFDWFFGPEWAGAELQVIATNGQTLGTWGLPAQIGPEGYQLSSSITTNATLLNGAEVFLDGQSVSTLAAQSTNSSITNAFRPGFDIEFDGTYQNGDWKIQRSDGTIALSGSVATLNDAITGRFTLTGTNRATLWTRVPGGDGSGGAWVPTPVEFYQNNNVTTYFATGATNPTTVPSPSPGPTAPSQPGPLSSPSPATTNTVTNSLAADELVEVNVPDAEVGSYDVGQADLVEEAQTVFARIAEGYENFADAFNYTSLTFNEFKNLYLPPPGKSCTFSFGPVTVNIGEFIPGWVRGASKLVFLLAALAAIKRMLWEAFA